MVFSMFGVQWIMMLRVLDIFSSWRGCFGCHRNKITWKWSLIPLWCLLREQNARSFGDQERTIPELKMFFLTSLFSWLHSLGFYSFSSLVDFIDHCTLHHDYVGL